METNSSQFEFIVTNTEQHGDRSKPSHSGKTIFKKRKDLSNLSNSTAKLTEEIPIQPCLEQGLLVATNALAEEIEMEGKDKLNTPKPSSEQIHLARPALSGQTSTHCGRRRGTQGPKRCVRTTQSEQALQQLRNADEKLRKFRIQQRHDYALLKKEEERIRNMEMQVQKEWHAIGLKALDLLNKLVNKYCKD